MPVVWPDGVFGGRNVIQSKRVGGYTRQAKAVDVPFTEESLSSMRRTIAKRLSEAKVCVCACVCCNCLWCVCVCVCLCVCVGGCCVWVLLCAL